MIKSEEPVQPGTNAYASDSAGHKSDSVVPFTLYHGTSTLFLDSIVEHGLGAKNPIADWGVLEFAQALLPRVESVLGADDQWVLKVHSFGRMARQETGRWNFQHGDTYLTPSQATAVRYATNKRYGSELLTYALDFLQELVRRDVPGIRDQLYRQFPIMFSLLDVSPSPLLVELDSLHCGALSAAENGEGVRKVLEFAVQMQDEHPDIFETICQQSNFRLGIPQPVQRLRISIINVSQWRPQGATCRLYPLIIDSRQGIG